MQGILENLKSLGWTRLAILGGTGLALVFALLFSVSVAVAPTYVTLYRDLSPAEASRVVDSLEQAGFRVRTDATGAVISVPQEDMARARMELAGSGLPSDGTPGWELFDEASGLGMNTFMQRVNRMRALEGELSRSIQTIQGVDAARVHLVLPEREPFSRDRPRPSASVIVRGSGSRQLSMRQAQSIRALVAAAVPELSPSGVTVLSATGETILSDDGEGSPEASIQGVRAGVEDRMSRQIAEILSARVGAGNARVQVSVDLSTSRQVVREQSYDPGQRVVRSTETREETREDQQAARGEVGVADNIPAALADGAPGGATNSSTRTDEIVNYEIGGTQREIIREPGDIEKVSVAVLVNGIYNVAQNGDVEYEERTAEELARLEELVRSAIGFNEERGDSVSVVSLRFMDYSMDVGEPVTRGFSGILSDNLPMILRGVFALALIGAVLQFGVRPALAGVLEDRSAGDDDEDALPGEEPQAQLPAQQDPNAANQAAVAGQAGQRRQPGAQQGAGRLHTGDILDPLPAGAEELVTLATVQGGVQRGWIKTVGELIEHEPDDSLKVVKAWLSEAR